MRITAILAATALAVAAQPLAAQGVSVTPFVGEMVPLKNAIMDTTGGSGTYFHFNAHTIYGLRVAKDLTDQVAVQVQGGVGKGDVEIVGGGTPMTLQSNVWFVDARARLRLIGTDRANLGLLAGAGWTRYTMGLIETAHILSDNNDLKGKVTGIVGLGLRARLTGSASFTADLTDRIHSQPLEAEGLTNPIEPTQHDLTMAFGLNFPLGE